MVNYLKTCALHLVPFTFKNQQINSSTNQLISKSRNQLINSSKNLYLAPFTFINFMNFQLYQASAYPQRCHPQPLFNSTLKDGIVCRTPMRFILFSFQHGLDGIQALFECFVFGFQCFDLLLLLFYCID